MKTLKRIHNYFKTGNFKEELVSIPVLILAFFALNWILGKLFPQSGFFDFFSQLETIAYKVLAFVVAITMAWLGLRIMFPSVFRYLHDEFYHKFEILPDEERRKWALRIFLVLLICAALVSSGRAGTREVLTKKLYSELNIREVRSNSSPEIDAFLNSVGIKVPAPWCVAFVSFNLSAFNVPNPRSAWSPDYAKPKDIIWTPKKPTTAPLAGDVFTLYYSSLHRVGHGGFYIRTDKSGYYLTIEGNTNGIGSRDGDGVYIKKRDPDKIHAITRYIK